MKQKIFLCVLLCCIKLNLNAQTVKFETMLEDPAISIRALQLYDDKVWYVATAAKFGYVSLKDSKNQMQKRLSEAPLQFRTLAQNKKYFYAITIESPGLIYQVSKKDLSSKIVFRDDAPTAFYDALKFTDQNFGIAFSDPTSSQTLNITQTRNGGERWVNCRNYAGFPLLEKGEAAFAASNTNIASHGKWIWIATGGVKSRIFRMKNKDCKWEVFDTPFTQGTSTQGIYSIDFNDDNFGIAVGGDYKNQADNLNNIATTKDGGKTWQIQASGANAGYMTCVKYRPGSKGKELVAVGDQHISISKDFGKTWEKISDEKNLYACEWIDQNTVVFAGKGRIIKMKID